MEEACQPGKCIRCGVKFSEIARTEVTMPLTDGSLLRVGVCLGCRDRIFDEDKGELWSALLRGWELQIEKLGWPLERRDKYMTGYRKKAIA